MFKKLFILTSLLFAWSASTHAATIAVNDGSVMFGADDYINGYDLDEDGNFINKSVIDSLISLGDNVIIKVTVGSFVDYYKPKPDENQDINILTMLTSSTNHLWSSSATGTFEAPSYWISPSLPHLGGSGVNDPRAFPTGRSYLNFWGSDAFAGGCCMEASGDVQAWGRAFTVETVSAVPIPAAAWLFGSALLGLVALKRRRA